MKTMMMLATLLVPLAISPVSAQRADARRAGFYASVGLGSGSAGVTCDGCDSDRRSKLTVMARFGGSVRPDLVIGGEVMAWSDEASDSGISGDMTLGFVGATAQYFPDPKRGLYLKGGLGVATSEVNLRVSGVGSAKLEATGLGLVAGVGYDIPLGRAFSLTPFADYYHAAKADAKINGSDAGEKLGFSVLNIGLAATWP